LRLWARSEKSAKAAAYITPDVTLDPSEAVKGADICILCTPIGIMPELATQFRDALGAAAVVTDAGSVKGPVVQRLETLLGQRFVGSHPMAGSERSGIEAARENLFQGAAVIVTPTDQTEGEAVDVVRSLWETVGCRVSIMSPSEHDEAVARISHLPHAAAAALVNAINHRMPAAGALAGGGYRDTTRIAAGPPAMWSEILLENKTPLIAGLDDLTDTLDELKAMLRSHDAPALESFLARAKEFRDTLT
jgi:prephenate dehydrogenase